MGLKAEEQPAAIELQSTLSSFSNWVSQFESALALYDHAESLLKQALVDSAHLNRIRDISAVLEEQRLENLENKKMFSAWTGIAIREGAMIIFHVEKTIDHLLGTLSRTPTLSALVSREKLKNATDIFNKNFENAVAMRNAVGHAAEYARDKNVGKHSIKGPFENEAISMQGRGQLFLSHTHVNRTLTVTSKGRYLTYDLTSDTLSSLVNVMNAFFEALQPAADFTKQAAMNAARKARQQRER